MTRVELEIQHTFKHVKELLESNGITAVDVVMEKGEIPVLQYKLFFHGEEVGVLYSSTAYLTESMPSLEAIGAYDKTELQVICFDTESDVEKLLPKTIKRLKRSAEEYDGIVRKFKIEKTKQYFRRRKNAINEQEQSMLAEMC